MNILIVLTSHSDLGDTGKKTGFWIEEFAAPYYYFIEAGANVTLASPKGGQPPIDPKSSDKENETPASIRFAHDGTLQSILQNTIPLSEISASSYDAIFFPGGHGPLWDLNKDHHSIEIIKAFWQKNKPIATVCHSPSVLLNVEDFGGNSIVKGKRVTAFSNSEEQEMGLQFVVPYSLETELENNGGMYSKGNNWEPYVVVDGMLITGQNPESSIEVAKQLITMLHGIQNKLQQSSL
ncbi:MAG: type 1 glutamine amidotransferase domain-containing protein [Chitinophagaceae bacterium]|jgi:putative intracellular protease/amidase|nr:type 1 glutamine amidotransferase domain-containing protein [Chitinophagaceae bacterium]